MTHHLQDQRKAQWRQVMPALVLLMTGVLFLYRDTAIAMVLIWERSNTYAHAYTVPPIVLWLIWQQRQALALQAPRPSVWMLFPIFCIGFVWLLGDLVSVNAVTQLAFTAILVLVVPVVIGTHATRTIAFPLAFLFFAVPIGDFLLPLLMGWTADFTVAALRLTGIPVYREGMQIVIPSGNWSVVEACSGVRYLVASFMVGTLFAYLKFHTLRRRLIFMGISIVVPIVANWIRAYMIVMIGHLSGNELAVGADHLIYGWVFFGIVMTIMFMLGARWFEPTPDLKLPSTASASVVQRPPGSTLWAVTVGAALIAALPQLGVLAIEATERGDQVRLAPLVRLAQGWRLSTQPVSDWAPAFQNPSAELSQVYKSKEHTVGVYMGYYRQQSYDRKLVSSQNVLTTSNNHIWAPVEVSTRTLQVGGTEVPTRATQLLRAEIAGQATRKRLLVWQVYWVNGTFTASDHWAKIYGALYRLLGRGDDAAVIILYAQDDQPGGADAALESFARANLDELKAQLRAARDSR